MPYKPKKPCGYNGCPNLTHDAYCAEHSEFNKPKRTPKHRPDSNKTYGRRWRKIRKPFIEQNPLCAECLKRGVYTPAEEVHHILPLSKGGTHDYSNLEALCKSCHSTITGKSRGGGS